MTGKMVGNTGNVVANTGNMVPNTGNMVPNTGNVVGNTGKLLFASGYPFFHLARRHRSGAQTSASLLYNEWMPFLSMLLAASLMTQASASIEGAVVKMGNGEPIAG